MKGVRQLRSDTDGEEIGGGMREGCVWGGGGGQPCHHNPKNNQRIDGSLGSAPKPHFESFEDQQAFNILQAVCLFVRKSTFVHSLLYFILRYVHL